VNKAYRRTFGGRRVPLSKNEVAYGVALTECLLDNRPDELREVAQLIADALASQHEEPSASVGE